MSLRDFYRRVGSTRVPISGGIIFSRVEIFNQGGNCLRLAINLLIAFFMLVAGATFKCIRIVGYCLREGQFPRLEFLSCTQAFRSDNIFFHAILTVDAWILL